ncbi:hypothetical protein P43SY_006354 [Pythium insidiosum]|uniref:PDZ domain-containing protein n=1 Tax=Pythium insidiosum TaxID=114742 RepID=A0AAD5M015_PYTIN|nr:hypothetical protein P43SY_006354 [Pythium insidiosum]
MEPTEASAMPMAVHPPLRVSAPVPQGAVSSGPPSFGPGAYGSPSVELVPVSTPSTAAKNWATQLLAVCDNCVIVVRVNGYDMSYRRIMERKCPRCGGCLTLPQEVMEMLILFGHFIPEPLAASVALGATVTHPTLRADFVAAAMNELLTPLQTDYVYDVALPKRRDGLGMSLRMHKGDLVVGGFIDFEDGSESPSVAARVISVGDILVAINKKSITSSTFEKNIRMLSHAASPVYLTFRRNRPVTLL